MNKHSEKWIQKAIKDEGSLRKHFNVGEGETIPTGKLKSEQANLALTLRSKEVPPAKGKKAMTLKGKLVRLAHAKPELRPHLLPLIKHGYETTVEEWEKALKDDEASLKKYEGYLKTLEKGKKVPGEKHITVEGVKKTISGLKAAIANKKKLIKSKKSKKAGEVPEAFKKQWKKNDKGKGDDDKGDGKSEKPWEKGKGKEAGHNHIDIDYVNFVPLWDVLSKVRKAWKKQGDAETAAKALYQLDVHIQDLYRELDEVAKASKKERTRFHYVGPLG